MKRAIILLVFCRILFIFGILVGHDMSMCIIYRFHGWLIFARVIALFMHGQSRYQIWIKCNKRQMTSCVHKMCERTYGQTNMKRAITLAKINHPVFCRILFIFGILIGHDLSMRILYRFHGWLIFVSVIALFMFIWPYVRPLNVKNETARIVMLWYPHSLYISWCVVTY
jgi:hypothetical protein